MIPLPFFIFSGAILTAKWVEINEFRHDVDEIPAV
jgi:hypothetical protein